MTRRSTKATVAASLGSAVLVGSLAVAIAPSAGASGPAGVRLRATLQSLNDSGVSGTATATVTGRVVRDVSVRARRLTPAGPHAQHIHFGRQARNECPTFRDDAAGDFRLNVADGVPAYGPIAVSLTTRGDASAASGLALDRMPVVNDHKLRYRRDRLTIDAVPGAARDGGRLPARKVARAIRAGKGVVVIHGTDYNGDGRYDMTGAGESEIAPGVPAEATDPTACGVLRRLG